MLNPISKARAAMMRKYRKLVAEFLVENPWCQVCACAPSEDVHHKKGRIGKLLIDMLYWLPVCRLCHDKIERKRTWAMEMGYSLDRLAK